MPVMSNNKKAEGAPGIFGFFYSYFFTIPLGPALF